MNIPQQSMPYLHYLAAINKERKSFNFLSFAVRRGLEPLTPCVTGTYSNQLN